MFRQIIILLFVVCSLVTTRAYAAEVLIVNGASATSEAGTTADITTALQDQLVANGDTVTVADTIPADLSPFDQFWEIRFFNAAALTGPEQAQVLAYLQAGGDLFLMGENASFAARNNSLFALIDAAGGGSLTFAAASDTQTINPGLRAPNNIETVTYDLAGAVSTAGTGVFLTSDLPAGGTAVGWSTGALGNAAAGSLVMVLDVNFMAGSGINGTELLGNLTGFVGTGGASLGGDAQAIPSVPLALLLLLALVVGGRGALSFRRKRS